MGSSRIGGILIVWTCKGLFTRAGCFEGSSKMTLSISGVGEGTLRDGKDFTVRKGVGAASSSWAYIASQRYRGSKERAKIPPTAVVSSPQPGQPRSEWRKARIHTLRPETSHQVLLTYLLDLACSGPHGDADNLWPQIGSQSRDPGRAGNNSRRTSGS